MNTFCAFADIDGDVQALGAGFTDNLTPIFYELETHELQFYDAQAQKTHLRPHLKKISDMIVVFCDNAIDSVLQIKTDNNNYQSVTSPAQLSKRVNILDAVNAEGYAFTLQWSGSSDGISPIFEGVNIENIEDLGMTDI